ncbi:MAG: glutamine synthetase family protein, partial [Primorskyibacter sp.]
PIARPLQPAPPPGGSARAFAGDVLCLRRLDAYDALLSDIYDACAAMDIPAQVASSESGPGQFEITLGHVPCALRAADNAWGFKQAVQGMAQRHGMIASFMAKPFAAASGSGFHAHVSLLDRDGRNIFDDGGPMGTPALGHAIRGCLDLLADSTLIWAPHANSYGRFVRDAHAPYGVAWGYDNRTVALRVPGGPTAARRLEHRVSGADTNPYLVLAAILGAMEHGLEHAAPPPPPLTGNAYEANLVEIPRDWASAITRFDQSPRLPDLFDPALIDNYLRMKRQEHRDIPALSEANQLEAHLAIV